MVRVRLFWKQTYIGFITETNWDMRSSGVIDYHFHYLEPGLRDVHLADYIKLSIKMSIVLEEGNEWAYQQLCEEENQFQDLIDSPEWYIINEEGQVSRILCPMFHDNDEITWQTVI